MLIIEGRSAAGAVESESNGSHQVSLSFAEGYRKPGPVGEETAAEKD